MLIFASLGFFSLARIIPDGHLDLKPRFEFAVAARRGSSGADFIARKI